MPRSASSRRPSLLRRGAGERAFLVAEQLAFDQARRQRRAAQPNERSKTSAAQIVNGPRDQFLAGSRFAEQQDGRIGGRDGPCRFQHTLEGGARADDRAEVVALPKLFLEVLLFLDEMIVKVGDLAISQCVFDGDGNLDRRLAEHIDLVRRKRAGPGRGDVQGAQDAAPCDERDAAERGRKRRAQCRHAGGIERVQVAAVEHGRDAAVEGDAGGRQARRQHDVRRGDTARLVIGQRHAQFARIAIVKGQARHTRVR